MTRIKQKATKRIQYLLFYLLLGCLSSCGVKYHFKKALTSFQIGEYYKSISALRKVNMKTSDRQKKALIQFKIAEAYYKIGQYRSAESYFKSALIHNPGDNIIWLHYAEVLRANGKYEEAITNYSAYLAVVPNDPMALNGIESSKKTTEWINAPTRYKIENLKAINSYYNDFSASYAGVHDNEIYFTSSRKGATGKLKSAITGEYSADLFLSTYNLQKQRWNKPQLIDDQKIIDTFDEEGAVSFNKAGDEMYFTRCIYKKSDQESSEIFSSKQLLGIWGEPKKIKVSADSLMLAHPSISADGKTLYFVSDRKGGYGGKDIWYATKLKENSWGKPINAGPEINTSGDEMFPYIREDGTLYFSSNAHVGMGGLDLFSAKKDAQNKWIVENLKSPLNSTGDDFAISFYPGEERGLFSSNREGSSKDDIYTFVLPPKVYEIEGDVFSKENGSRINDATVKLIGTDGTMLKVKAENGKFKFKLKPEVEYIIAGYRKGFLNAKTTASTIGLEEGKQFQVRLDLNPADLPISIDNIQYAFGKTDLLPESKSSLDSLTSLLTLNPTIVIELMSHSDCRGDDAVNSEISQKRAQSVVAYLIAKGIQPGRLVAKGYGESSPKKVTKKLAKSNPFLKTGITLTCAFIETLSDEKQREICHQINRRTEFRVLSSDYHEKFEK
jgi:peptidoglycan-associated lipoprotein